jgi:quinolinate synthase
MTETGGLAARSAEGGAFRVGSFDSQSGTAEVTAVGAGSPILSAGERVAGSIGAQAAEATTEDAPARQARAKNGCFQPRRATRETSAGRRAGARTERWYNGRDPMASASAPLRAARALSGSSAAASIDPSLDLEKEIVRLKKERNAVVLAHYYQDSDIQDVADFLGDSLQLAQAAKTTKADVICFAGVHFMAETAKILNPDRIVVVPDMEAGCSLSDGCPVERYKRWREAHPGAVGVTYINCSAAVKAESDYIVTSSNAEKIVRAIPADKTILFAPDRNLGRHIQKVTGREMVLWPGSCLVHETFSERKIIGLLERHPGAKIVAHPECEETLLAHASFIGSTTALLKHVIASDETTFIVATEPGILHQMQKGAPHKTLIPAPPHRESCACNECPHMKRNSLEKVYLALRDLAPRIEMSESLRERARVPIDRMLALS